MPLVKWSEELAVGVDALDADHQRMFGLAAQLYSALLAGQGRDALGTILEQMIAYYKEHFAREEAFLASSGYPDVEDHKREHVAALQRVLDIQEKNRTGVKGAVSLEFMNYMNSWIVKHILGSDMKYSAFLAAKSAK